MLNRLKRTAREAANFAAGRRASRSPPPVKDLKATAALCAHLVGLEARYGGLVEHIPRRRLSPHDPRSAALSKAGTMRGGDRMNPLLNDYAPVYAAYLAPLIGQPDLVICEVGILTGVGLAIWCDVFPDARVIGLDIDIANFQNNRAALVAAGAFRTAEPEVHTFDQFAAVPDDFARILGGRTIDVLIDDGVHTDETIERTFKAARPHLSPSAIFFSEDNATVSSILERDTGFAWRALGGMTVGSR